MLTTDSQLNPQTNQVQSQQVQGVIPQSDQPMNQSFSSNVQMPLFGNSNGVLGSPNIPHSSLTPSQGCVICGQQDLNLSSCVVANDQYKATGSDLNQSENNLRKYNTLQICGHYRCLMNCRDFSFEQTINAFVLDSNAKNKYLPNAYSTFDNNQYSQSLSFGNLAQPGRFPQIERETIQESLSSSAQHKSIHNLQQDIQNIQNFQGVPIGQQSETLLSYFSKQPSQLQNSQYPASPHITNSTKLEDQIKADFDSKSSQFEHKQQSLKQIPHKIEIPADGNSKLLGKRQRSSIIQSNTNLKEELKQDIDQVKLEFQSNTNDEDHLEQDHEQFKKQASENLDNKSSEMTKLKIIKALDVNNISNNEIFQKQNDPCQYLIKEILTPILLQIDKLQIMRRDKHQFQVNLQPKDLKILPKDRREEILNSKVYFDIQRDPQTNEERLVLTIDKQEHLRQSEISAQSVEVDVQKNIEYQREETFNLRNNNIGATNGNFLKEEGESPDTSRMEVEGEDSVNQRGSAKDDEDSFLINDDQIDKNLQSVNTETKSKRKKKRKGFSSNTQKKAAKQISSLPSNLSDFTWIDNTEHNKQLLEAERMKQIELRLQKEHRKSIERMKEESVVTPHFSLQIQTTEQINTCVNPLVNNKPDESFSIIKEETKGNNEESKNDRPKEYIFRTKSELKTFDDIWERAEDGFYHSLSDLLFDVELVIKLTMSMRCMNSLSKIYLTSVLNKVQQFLKTKTVEFKFRWRNYFEARFAQNEQFYPKIRGNWYKAAGPKREYNLLQDYKIVTPLENNPKTQNSQQDLVLKNDIINKMKTTKTSKCQGDCCLRIEELGPFKLGSDVWESKCNCRLARVECNETCGCDPKICQNRQMAMNQALKLGEDVIEKISWGIDMCTAVNLMSLLPRDTPAKIQSEFVESRLVYAIQQQGDKGYDARQALQFIIDSKDNERFRTEDKELAQIVLSGIRMVRDKIERHFRVHSKGIGIFCKRKEGIKSNNLIIEYFGEIYQPWNWYEKQDVLKQGQNKSNLSKDLPDFYNITYERHYDDPSGYDILMVDPILYGNYSSRLSHSCSPNCSTVIHTRKGQYSIGMFAIKDVAYGEELCFNYCSLTESEKEYEAAVCLCGTEICQGRFLQLANDKKHQAIMKKYHTFVDRNYLIFKACTNPVITQEDNQRLKDFGIKQSVLKDVPDWLKKWASLVCEYILFEEEKYPHHLAKEYPHSSAEDFKYDAKNLRDSKVWNVVITIDKVVHVLKSMGCFEPPVRELSNKEKFYKLWETDDQSFKDSLIGILKKLEPCQERQLALDSINQTNRLIATFNEEYSQGSEERIYGEKLSTVYSTIAGISDLLRPVQSHVVTIQAFCDVLWLYANTNTYFTPNENYKKCKGEEQKIRKCDVRFDNQSQASLNPLEQEKCVYRGSKEYDPGYIWGQLVGWFKQTVDKPNASLSADRRGTLSMPDLESFLVSAKNQEDLKSDIKRKKKRKGGNKSDEDLDTEVSFLKKGNGTRSRPGGKTKSQQLNNADQDTSMNAQTAATSANQSANPIKYKDIKVQYPHKKHQTREAFLQHWPENFSKQWDVCCKWSFKNRHRMYGSIQFESVKHADNDRQRRLYLFNTVLNHLLPRTQN